MRTYAEVLRGQDQNLMIVFVDAEGRFKFSSSANKLISSMQDEQISAEIVGAIEYEDVQRLAELVAVQSTRVEPGASNADVLRRMLDTSSDALIAVGSDGRPTGIVRRDDIMARMLAKLAPG